MSIFAAKNSYYVNDEQGKSKKVTEQRLVWAVSFTDAEAKLAALPQTGTDQEVSAIGQKHFNDIIKSNDDRGNFYVGKFTILAEDEKTGKIKKATQRILVQADDLAGALKVVQKEVASWLVDAEIVSISLTPYLEILD